MLIQKDGSALRGSAGSGAHVARVLTTGSPGKWGHGRKPQKGRGGKQAGILRTEIVAKCISQTSPSEEQTSPFKEGERERALPKIGL